MHEFPVQIAHVVKRPSKICKSPYMADIIIDDNEYLAHSPSLGCSGLTDKDCHVYVIQNNKNTNTKSTHKIMFAQVYETWESNTYSSIVCTHPQIAEDIVSHALQNNLLNNIKAASFQSQVTFGNSRFDFSGIDDTGNEFIIEVKCVPVADYHNVSKQVKKNMIKNNKFYDKHPSEKIAIFPDGYVKPSKDKTPRPQSERANKHICELADIKKSQDIRTIMIYVVQRADSNKFVISDLDPVYKNNVHIAQENGVEIYYIQMEWKCENNIMKGNIIGEYTY